MYQSDVDYRLLLTILTLCARLSFKHLARFVFPSFKPVAKQQGINYIIMLEFIYSHIVCIIVT